MRGVSVLFVIGLYTTLGNAQFLNNRPFPTYSLENMPDTEFSCRDKILGGYYADVDAQCQMFHVCVKVAGVGVQDFRFLCPNGTAFDQDHQICAEWEDVDCDATTLYYSSDNFDLYRIGSGFESKAKKYGEDEETFALQRAETGDVRLNREHQTQRVNQQKEKTYQRRPQQQQQQSQRVNQQQQQPQKTNQQQPRPNNNNNQDNERDIFRGSSSSNFFNNRNGGKETDEDYDDNVNANQNNDQFQKRKLNKKPVRRPNYNNQQQETTAPPVSTTRRIKQQPRNEEEQTNRPQKPTGFINNFAGSSYVPTTTPRGTTTLSNERYTIAVNNHRVRNGQRHRAPIPDRQYNNADNFRQSQSTSEPLTVSTPAPFRQQNQYNNAPARQPTQSNNNQQNYQSTNKQTTQNYPRPSNNQQNDEYNDDFEIKKSTKGVENYPQKSNFDVKKSPAPFQAQNDNNPTTYSPKKQFYQSTTKKFENYPTTFSPKTNQGYNTISQVTTQYNNQNTQGQNNQKQQQNYQNNQQQQFNTQKPQPFSNQNNNFNSQPPQPFLNQKSNNYNQFSSQKSNFNQQSTPKTTQFTQYTPTVPKITSTTPLSRSNRFDETQYDDGSYNSKYDYDDKREDEFLKTAHSQNIAKSRNDLAKSQKAAEQNKQSNNKPQYESPRPFSVTPNAPAKQDYTRPSQPITPRYTQQQTLNNNNNNNNNNKQRVQQQVKTTTQAPKKVKDVSYDYAYYDTNGPEPEYDIDTEIKKSKN